MADPVRARAAGFAEGVEAAAAWHDARAKLERQSDAIAGARAEEYAAQQIRALAPPAAPDPLLAGLMYVRHHMPLVGARNIDVQKCAERWLDAEIARRGSGGVE